MHRKRSSLVSDQDNTQKGVYRDHQGRRLKVLDENYRFRFECDQCGRCCRGSTIPLNPYDILKMSDYYGITAQEFLEEFTLWSAASQSGIPVVLLKAEPRCPFNHQNLCNVYEVRPFFCRSYPVIRIMVYNTATSKVTVKYSLEKNCSTVKTKKTHTIREWLAEQCGETYLQKSLRWGEFKVRLAGTEYPKDDEVFHRLFYNFMYALGPTEDEMKAMGISESDSSEGEFEARIKFASSLDWSRATEKAKTDGALLYIKHIQDLNRRLVE
jgi:Fe-S-cluster containining protein